MSETTTYRVEDIGEGGEYAVLQPGFKFGDLPFATTGTRADAERIARLLTEDDEQQAKNGHFDRAWAVWSENGSQAPNEAWQEWWNGISARLSSAKLDALEAAYRAATEADK